MNLKETARRRRRSFAGHGTGAGAVRATHKRHGTVLAAPVSAVFGVYLLVRSVTAA